MWVRRGLDLAWNQKMTRQSRSTSRDCPTYCGLMIRNKCDSVPTNYPLAARLDLSRQRRMLWLASPIRSIGGGQLVTPCCSERFALELHRGCFGGSR
jgi:hypothetical protein